MSMYSIGFSSTATKMHYTMFSGSADFFFTSTIESQLKLACVAEKKEQTNQTCLDVEISLVF